MRREYPRGMSQDELTTDDLLFVAFNGRVLAIRRDDGAIVWRWSSGKSEYVCLLPDGDKIFVSCRGYTWALDPHDGRELWHQPFKGEGVGFPALATMRGAANDGGAAAAMQQQDRKSVV